MQSLIYLITIMAALAAVDQDTPAKANSKGIQPAKVGLVEGTVRFTGEVPRLTVVDDRGQHRPLFVVAPKSGGLRDAVVYIEPVDGKDAPKRSGDATPEPRAFDPQLAANDREEVPDDPPPVVIDQQDHTFVPHVLAIESGRRIQFTNGDAVNHNVRAAALAPENEMNVYTGAGGGYTHRFRTQRRNLPVRLGCDIHPWMQAWIYVFDHSHFAVTGKQGRFRIRGVAPGEYRLTVRQPDGGLQHEQQIRVRDGEATRTRITFSKADLKLD